MSNPTKAQSDRMAIIKSMQCIACEIEHCRQPLPTEVHHIVDKGYRKHSGGHDSTIPLCVWHHRGDTTPDLSASSMAYIFGPSLARSKRHFFEMYGTERELLAIINSRLEKVAA